MKSNKQDETSQALRAVYEEGRRKITSDDSLLISPASTRGMSREGSLYLPDDWDREEPQAADETDSELIFSHDIRVPKFITFKRPERVMRGIPSEATDEDVAFIDSLQDAGVRVHHMGGGEIKPRKKEDNVATTTVCKPGRDKGEMPMETVDKAVIDEMKKAVEFAEEGRAKAEQRANRLERELRVAKARAELAEADRNVLAEENKSLLRNQRRLDETIQKVQDRLYEYDELLEEERYEE